MVGNGRQFPQQMCVDTRHATAKRQSSDCQDRQVTDNSVVTCLRLVFVASWLGLGRGLVVAWFVARLCLGCGLVAAWLWLGCGFGCGFVVAWLTTGVAGHRILV